jgi:ketosteroid isomerase-like protein
VQRYATAADRRDRDAFASVFCDDGVLVTPRGELRGHAELATVPDRLARYDQTRHTITGHEVTSIDGDEATAQTWCTAEHLTIGDVCMETYELRVRYDDRLRRDAGEWRIAERVLVVLAEERRQG